MSAGVSAVARPPRSIAIVLFLLVWTASAWFGSWEFNANNETRLFAAISLIEDGDATIDEFADLTIDKAKFGAHAYLDKAPGMTLMALPAVALANAATGERSAGLPKVFGDPQLSRFLKVRLRLAAVTGPALLTAIAAVMLYDLALGLTGSARAGLFATLGYALGTPIWGWSTTIFGHAAVAALYVIAVWAVWRATRERSSLGFALLSGLSLGWAVVVEYQAVLAGSAIGVWALVRFWPRADRWRLFGAVAVGGVIALLPLIGYNLLAFGTPFKLGYQGVVGFEGMNQGLFGLTTPSLKVLGEITLGGRRGLMWIAPVLVLAPFGLVALIRARGTRGIGVMAAAVVAIVLLVNAAYVYWDGGNSTGPRLAMPMAGLLALGLAPVWVGLRSEAARLAAAALLALSIAINAAIAAAETLAPPEFQFPLWSAVLEMRFLKGDMRTMPSEWWGWTTWSGFWLLVVLAVPVLVWLARAAGEVDRGRSMEAV